MNARLRRAALAGCAVALLAGPAAQAACTPAKPAPKPTPGRGTYRVSQFCTLAKQAAYDAAGFTCVNGRLAKK
jgi:hypothetical protein